MWSSTTSTSSDVTDRYPRAAVLLTALMSFAVGSCAGSVAAPEASRIEPTEIWIQEYAFVPLHQYAVPGTRVTWVNRDQVAHLVVSGTPDEPGRWFESEVIRPGESFTYDFEQEGRYRYHCGLHTGRIRTLSDMPVLFVRPQKQPGRPTRPSGYGDP